MLRISSQLTRTEHKQEGDETVKVDVPVPAFFKGFFWPVEGIIVPEDWLGGQLEEFCNTWNVLVETETEDGWKVLSKRVRKSRGQDTDGPSPPFRPGPSPEALREAARRGILKYDGNYHIPVEPDEGEEDDRAYTPDFGPTDRERQGLNEPDPDKPSHKDHPKIPEYDKPKGKRKKKRKGREASE